MDICQNTATKTVVSFVPIKAPARLASNIHSEQLPVRSKRIHTHTPHISLYKSWFLQVSHEVFDGSACTSHIGLDCGSQHLVLPVFFGYPVQAG